MQRISLNGSDWTLIGLWPNSSRLGKSKELGEDLRPILPKIKASVPGAVQLDLLKSGDLQDINVGLNSRSAEWVEHWEWAYSKTVAIPQSMEGKRIVLEFEGLDYSGRVYVDGVEVGEFEGTHLPHSFDLSSVAVPGKQQVVSVVFDPPPRLPGQLGHTWKVQKYKPRFNYIWDWVARTVSIGIWGNVWLCAYDEARFEKVFVNTDLDADLRTGTVRMSLVLDQEPDIEQFKISWYFEEKSATARETPDAESASDTQKTPPGIRTGATGVSVGEREYTIELRVDGVKPWYPNNAGEQPLYWLRVQLANADGRILDQRELQLGFKHVEWVLNEDSPQGARASTLVINGRKVFLRGVNWVPLSSFFGGVSAEDYRERLAQYKRMNVNILRVWGGGILEKTEFYSLCDELGLLVWQEMPLSGSGLSDYPPVAAETISLLSTIAAHMVTSRCHHVSHLLWDGGNELSQGSNGEWDGREKPVDVDHPLIAELARIVDKYDPGKKFIPTSGHGPRSFATEADFGKGLHHDVHGPWAYLGPEKHYEYWNNEDALWRSEVGVPGYTAPRLVTKNAGGYTPWPATAGNRLWLHHGAWWINDRLMEEVFGRWDERDANQLSTHLTLSRYLQSEGYRYTVESCRRKAVRCSLVTVWMGHDCFWTTANNSVIEYDGSLKPAYSYLQRSFAPLKVSLKYDRLWVRPHEESEVEVWVLKDQWVELEAEAEVEVTIRDVYGNSLREWSIPTGRIASFGGCLGSLRYALPELPNKVFFLEVRYRSRTDTCRDVHDVYILGQDENHPLSGLRRLQKTELVVRDTKESEEGGEKALILAVENAGTVASVLTEVVSAEAGGAEPFTTEGNGSVIFPKETCRVKIYGTDIGSRVLEVTSINAARPAEVDLSGFVRGSSRADA